jgi:hypothetical protein
MLFPALLRAILDALWVMRGPAPQEWEHVDVEWQYFGHRGGQTQAWIYAMPKIVGCARV